MNNLSIIVSLIILICFSYCGTVISEPQYTTSATILLINETAVVIKSYDSIQGYEIQPGDTIIHTESYTTEYKEEPTVDSYWPLGNVSGGELMFLYGDSSKCENGLQDKENFENGKEVAPLVFEFTFRFTEERRAKAIKCY